MEAKIRISRLKKGDLVTNISTSEDNPFHHCYFVKLIIKNHKNKAGINHTQFLARCKNGRHKGDFDITSIFTGHLSTVECEDKSSKLWEAEFGNINKGD